MSSYGVRRLMVKAHDCESWYASSILVVLPRGKMQRTDHPGNGSARPAAFILETVV